MLMAEESYLLPSLLSHETEVGTSMAVDIGFTLAESAFGMNIALDTNLHRQHLQNEQR
jgi:hypothetical protein